MDGCADGAMDGGLKRKIGEASSNSSRVPHSPFSLWESLNHPSYGLNNRKDYALQPWMVTSRKEGQLWINNCSLFFLRIDVRMVQEIVARNEKTVNRVRNPVEFISHFFLWENMNHPSYGLNSRKDCAIQPWIVSNSELKSRDWSHHLSSWVLLDYGS